jgi:xylulokinase
VVARGAAVSRQLTAAAPDAEVVGVGLSGQMHGSVFLDGAGRVIRPALLWNDARTGPECAEIERRLGRERVLRITGNLASAASRRRRSSGWRGTSPRPTPASPASCCPRT